MKELKSSRSHNVLDVDVNFGFESESTAAVAEEISQPPVIIVNPNFAKKSSPAKVAGETWVFFRLKVNRSTLTVVVITGWRFLSSANRAANVRVCGLGFAGNGADAIP